MQETHQWSRAAPTGNVGRMFGSVAVAWAVLQTGGYAVAFAGLLVYLRRLLLAAGILANGRPR